MKIKKDDKVYIRQGKDKGKRSKVLKAYPKDRKVLVEGVAMVKKRARSQKQGEKGKTVDVPSRIPVSRVQLICGSCKKPTRVGYKGQGKDKVRICKKCNKEI